MRLKLSFLLSKINSDLILAEKRYKDSKKSATEIAISASASPSQSGDRFHSQGASDMAKQRLETVKKLKKEIEESLDSPTPDFIVSPCFVKTDKLEFYLVENTILISDIKLVSVNSELGQKIINKKVGDVVGGSQILEIG